MGSIGVPQGLSYSVACEVLLDQRSNLCPINWLTDSLSTVPSGKSVACTFTVFPAPFTEEAVFLPTVYSHLLCCRFSDHMNVDLLVGSLFCCIDLCDCFCASTILFSLLKLCTIV